MGWWKIDNCDSGGISCTLPTGHPGGDAPSNAVPGRDAPEDLYNGDGPADMMGAAIKQINQRYLQAWGRQAQPDEMQACFNFVFHGWVQRVHTPPAPIDK